MWFQFGGHSDGEENSLNVAKREVMEEGEKTIESRWSMHKVAPYGKVSVGDEILLKETAKM